MSNPSSARRTLPRLKWIGRFAGLALAAVALSGCIIVPGGGGYRPFGYHYYR